MNPNTTPTSQMDTPNLDREQRNLWPRKTLNIRFTSPAHLVDSIEFCHENGLSDSLKTALMSVICLFARDASGWSSFDGPDGHESAQPGQVVQVTFSPDQSRRPSFTWRAETVPDTPGASPYLLMAGKLIYRDNEGWSLHT